MIRLIEHQPAWELHAFLHFSGLSYKCEYSPTPMALGHILPIIIIESVTYSGEGAFDIIKLHGKEKRHYHHSDELIACYLQKKLILLFQQLEKQTGSEKAAILSAENWGINVYVATLLQIHNSLDPIG